MNNKIKFLLIIILLFISFLRLFKLTENPEGFDQTEAAFSYNAYSISKTAKDEYGKFLPLVLVSIGDYKLSGFSYWQIPFISILGLNEFSARFSVVTAGIISLVFIYLIIEKLTHDRKVALLTLFFASISPWHLVLSRMAYDPMVALMFFLSSVLLFIYWYKKTHLFLILLSMLALSLSVLTYYSVWLIAPFALLVFWLFIYKKHFKIAKFLYLTVILLIPIFCLTILVVNTKGQRLSQDSTFQVHAKPLLDEQVREDQHQFPLVITRLFHNKVTFYPITLLQNFSKNLSLDFLFLTGDKIDRRFSVPFSGVLYLWTAPFLILGLLYFWKNYSFAKNLLILIPILIIFLGSSFSEFGSETERTLFAAPLFSFLISYGLKIVYDFASKNKAYSILLTSSGMILIYNMAFFNHQYYWHSNVHEPWGRNFGAEVMVSTVSELQSKYNGVVIPDSSYIYFYFYNKVNPEVAWLESSNVNKEINFLGSHLRSRIGQYTTMTIECPPQGQLHILYVCQGNKVPKNSKIIKIIRFRDNQPAFIFIEFTSEKVNISLPEGLNLL